MASVPPGLYPLLTQSLPAVCRICCGMQERSGQCAEVLGLLPDVPGSFHMLASRRWWIWIMCLKYQSLMSPTAEKRTLGPRNRVSAESNMMLFASFRLSCLREPIASRSFDCAREHDIQRIAYICISEYWRSLWYSLGARWLAVTNASCLCSYNEWCDLSRLPAFPSSYWAKHLSSSIVHWSDSLEQLCVIQVALSKIHWQRPLALCLRLVGIQKLCCRRRKILVFELGVNHFCRSIVLCCVQFKQNCPIQRYTVCGPQW